MTIGAVAAIASAATLHDNTPHIEGSDSGAGFIRRLIGELQSGALGGWLADWTRFWWTLLSLNLGKTIFVLRGRRTQCPCQNPSDSGRAWHTGCDPSAAWHRAARFRRVCPLLKKAPDGRWLCSVDTAKVRPFWGRACAWYAGALAVLYLIAGIGVYTFLRTVGYPVSFGSVAWPPAWHEIREARAKYFFDKGQAALRANRTNEAILSLSQSYQLDPSNYAAGRILAFLWQSSEADVSNQMYQKLMADHPEAREQTAESWYQNLLARGDFRKIETLAWDRLNSGTPNIIAWLNIAIVSSRRAGDDDLLKKASSSTTAPTIAKVMAALELKVRGARPDAARLFLIEISLPQNPAPEAAAYLDYYRIEWLIEAGFADDAFFQLDREESRLLPTDRYQLRLDTYAIMGRAWDEKLIEYVRALLALVSPGKSTAGNLADANRTFVLEMLCAHLIRYPNSAILALVASEFERSPPGSIEERASAYMAFLCAAGAAGDWKELQRADTWLKAIASGRIATLSALEGYFRGESHQVPIERYLPALPQLPPSVIYALYAYSDKQRPAKK